MYILGMVSYPVCMAILLPTGIAVEFNRSGKSLRTSKIKRDFPNADKNKIKKIRKQHNKSNLANARSFAADLLKAGYQFLENNTLNAAEQIIALRDSKYQAEIEKANNLKYQSVKKQNTK